MPTASQQSASSSPAQGGGIGVGNGITIAERPDGGPSGTLRSPAREPGVPSISWLLVVMGLSFEREATWQRDRDMSGNYVSESGKRVTEKMSATVVIEDKLTALQRAKNWADELMDAEFQGRGDKEKSVRYRLSRKTGVPESYLFRLQYKTRDMKDVAGSVYQALMLAKAAYDRACEANENAANRYRAERELLGTNHETTDQEPVSTGKGMAVPAVGKAKKRRA